MTSGPRLEGINETYDYIPTSYVDCPPEDGGQGPSYPIGYRLGSGPE